MGILLRVIRFALFVAVILCLGQIKVGERRVAEHLTLRLASAWKTGPEPWLRESSAKLESSFLSKWLIKFGIETERSHPAPSRRATRPHPIVDDIEARDRARLKTLLDRELK